MLGQQLVAFLNTVEHCFQRLKREIGLANPIFRLKMESHRLKQSFELRACISVNLVGMPDDHTLQPILANILFTWYCLLVLLSNP